MLQNKYLVAIGITVGVLAVGGGGFAIVHARGHSDKVSYGRASLSADGTASTTASGAIPLGGSATSDDDSNGLKATTSGSAGSLGQLGSSGSGGSGSSGGQSLVSGSSSGGGSSSSGSGLPDPSTFKDYEKYKDGTQALFGDIQKGTGKELGANQKAAVYYRGYLTDGTLFDASRADSSGKVQPFTFTLGAHQVISGWEQGLAGMKVGGVRLLIVPPSVGYGASGQGSIPPNAVLVFEVQLADVQ